MTEIKPRIVDGEPVCFHMCEYWQRVGDTASMPCPYRNLEQPCIPGLRQQRDSHKLKWCEGDPPEGVEVLYQGSHILNRIGVHTSTNSCGHWMVNVNETLEVPTNKVTRWIPLADVLEQIK